MQLWEAFLGFWINNWNYVVMFFVVLIGGWFLVKALTKWIRAFLRKSPLDNVLGDFIASCARVALLLVYVIAIMSMLGIPTTSMVAVLSAFALALSLAMQNSLGNIASGILIATSETFSENDFVDIGGQSGTVKDITIFHTVLQTGDGKIITVPNSTVTSSAVINYSRMENRRVDITFSAAYGSDIDRVKEIILAVCQGHELILDDPAPFVRLSEHGASSLNFVCRAWCRNSDYWTVYHDLLEEVYKAFALAGIEIPYQQLDLRVKSTVDVSAKSSDRTA